MSLADLGYRHTCTLTRTVWNPHRLGQQNRSWLWLSRSHRLFFVVGIAERRLKCSFRCFEPLVRSPNSALRHCRLLLRSVSSSVAPLATRLTKFPISRDPPEGGTTMSKRRYVWTPDELFPISRDPPEGGTSIHKNKKGEKVERAFSPHRRSGPGSVSLEFLPDSGLVQSPASGIHPNSGLTAPLWAGKPPSRAGEIRKPPSRAGVSNF